MKALLRRARALPGVLPAGRAVLRGARALGLWRSRRIYSHFPYVGIVEVDCGAGTFRIRSRGHNIENGLYWDGIAAHEPRTMAIWMREAARSRVVLDVGANSGVFALAAAACGAGAVHAFEPVPRVHAILAENFALNPGLPLHAWACAAGAETGTASIFDPGGDAPTSASLSERFAREHFGDLPATVVEVVAIDDFCAREGIARVDLVKIDVEGFEEQALAGMRATVAASSPTIVMEVLPEQEARLRAVVEATWPGRYDWQPIDEGAGHASRNVLLRPRAVAA
jgi:FkbM family methyltransferase